MGLFISGLLRALIQRAFQCISLQASLPLFRIFRNASKRLCSWADEYFKQLGSYKAFPLEYEHELLVVCVHSTKYAKYAKIWVQLELNFEHRFHFTSQTSLDWKCVHLNVSIFGLAIVKSTSDWKKYSIVISLKF